MYTQELLVHKCSQGKAVEGVHTCVIHPLWILNSTCHGEKRGRENRGCQVKQRRSHTSGKFTGLGRKGSPQFQKLPFCWVSLGFPPPSRPSPTETVLTCTNIKAESCNGPECAFKWTFEVSGWTAHIINSFLARITQFAPSPCRASEANSLYIKRLNIKCTSVTYIPA